MFVEQLEDVVVALVVGNDVLAVPRAARELEEVVTGVRARVHGGDEVRGRLYAMRTQTNGRTVFCEKSHNMLEYLKKVENKGI